MVGASRQMEPEHRPPDLDRWRGLWVAMLDGEVVAAANSSRELVVEVDKLGERGRNAVARFVAPPPDAYIVGVG